ncbi:ABC transporter ATP-binding protein [candidate division KSB1 bacterium]|nr:ABC transporter ATP-binding protein [candidate division KSB1 bacterium]NIR69138.1 ABC transporter ATP-binding protein [candidate division KSB1 bacterium]NIS25649.1 ABC transporter ATP-binding protein [candidate division KSB1 bacterium]NIT72517.1 ABC transporter ATP-binding protein [candidate division KSB1 bacterium]NIU26326.1 ABC transporter ATP-binding protein [candidate division KSB1 bacterium]
MNQLDNNTTSLRLNDVHKRFGTEQHPVEVLRGVSFDVSDGEALVITGPSGSGKSTLLHLIGTLDTPTSGVIEINGENPILLSEPNLARFRNKVIGFVFQAHYLLPQYSVLENVLIPTLADKKNGDSEQRARTLLEKVGLSHRIDHRPAELSGGEQQRVATARALINQPNILLCDEPTGNLDRKTADSVADLFFELHQEEHNVLIVVTHSLDLASRFKRRFELQEGKCVEA